MNPNASKFVTKYCRDWLARITADFTTIQHFVVKDECDSDPEDVDILVHAVRTGGMAVFPYLANVKSYDGGLIGYWDEIMNEYFKHSPTSLEMCLAFYHLDYEYALSTSFTNPNCVYRIV